MKRYYTIQNIATGRHVVSGLGADMWTCRDVVEFLSRDGVRESEHTVTLWEDAYEGDVIVDQCNGAEFLFTDGEGMA